VSGAPKFIFGTSIKQQVADRIRAHIAANFDNNSAKAAKELKLSRQRLFSYTSAKTLPRPRVIDLILQKWGLDLLGRDPRRHVGTLNRATVRELQPIQGRLFDSPITLKSEELTVVIRRKGPRLVARIEVSADVEIA
jgi:hypothetical protein